MKICHLIGRARKRLALFRALPLALTLAAWGAGSTLAHAGTFIVNPVRVTLSAKQPVVAITVRNSGAEPAVVQLESSAWTQDQGKDVLSPNADLLATPPIFTLPPGGSQIVRVGLRSARSSSGESTYRLVLREVPPAVRPQGVQVMLMISLPVFVLPATPVKPELVWKAARTADGKVRVSATNNGNAHVQLGKLDLATGTGTVVGTRTLSEYVLPGNTKSWLVDAPSGLEASATMQILSTSDAGDQKSTVALETGLAAIQDARLSR
jgi:fimbrial chaperone protein